MDRVTILNLDRPLNPPIFAVFCSSFWLRLRGLMFRNSLGENEAVILADTKEARLDAAIHMFFMNFDIAAVWLNSGRRVTDVKLARRWHPIYMPNTPSQYVLEIHASRVNDFRVGDRVKFADVQ
jgi:uncharacterized membrane protein (UPF0127 family)